MLCGWLLFWLLLWLWLGIMLRGDGYVLGLVVMVIIMGYV